MTDGDDVERLRRLAYGPGASARERADAEAALGLKDEEDRHRVELQGVAGTPAVEPAAVEPTLVELTEDESGGVDGRQRASGIRPIWLLPIIVASIAIGAVGANLSADRNGPEQAPPSPADSGLGVTPATAPPFGDGPGDVDGAEQWLARAATADDVFPYPERLVEFGVTPESVRSAGNSEPGWMVWIAKQGDTGYCLLATTNLKDAVFSACATIVEFEASGLSLNHQGHGSYWDGAILSSGFSGFSG